MSTDPKHPDSEVATGDRRDELHYERDPDQLVKVRATFTPEGPLPPQESPTGTGAAEPQGGPPIEDVVVAAPGPSVWDARPPEDEEARG